MQEVRRPRSSRSGSSRAASGRKSSRHKSSRRAAKAKLVRLRLKDLGISLSTTRGKVNDFYNIWIAKAFADVPLPSPWSEYSDEKGRVFYYNHVSGVSKWEHPLYNTFRGLLERSRLEPDLARTGYFKDLYYKLRKYCIQPSSKEGSEGQEEAVQLDNKGWWALNLLAATSSKRDTGPPPSPEEVREMCVYLGIETSTEAGLAWIAKQAVQAALPPDWYEAEDQEGNNFYFNSKSGESCTSHPLDEYFLALVKSERRTKQKLEHRRQSMLLYTSEVQDDKYSGRLSIALFESYWESIRSEWVPFIARKEQTYWYNFETNEKIYLPFWEPKYRIAGRKIAHAWIEYKARQELRDHAAVIIQSNYRRYAIQSAILQWQKSCAAICIQCYVRRWLAQKYIRRNAAAITIQRAVREYLFMMLQQKHVAATVIQSYVRKVLAKKEQIKRIAQKKKIQARLRIQANMRRIAEQRIKEERMKMEAGAVIREAYLAYRLKKEINRRIQRKILLKEKQMEYMRKYRSQVMSRKATRIQSIFRGYLVRKEVRSWAEAAVTIQTCFRQYLVDRRNRVRALVHMYYDVHASKIQKQWKAFSHFKSVEERDNAALTIQKHFRTFMAVQRKRKAISAIVKIQLVYLRWKRWKDYKAEKAKAEQRAYIVRRMQPFCYALGISIDYVIESTDKELGIEGQIRTLSKLVEKRKNLHMRAMGEIAKVCSSLPADMQDGKLSIAEKGSPGWLSDESMKALKSSLKTLTEMRNQNLSMILKQSEEKLMALCDSIKVSDQWKAKHLKMDRDLGVQTLEYQEILMSRLRSSERLAKSLNPLVNTLKLFKMSLENKAKGKVNADFSKFPVVLRTLKYIMSETKKHRAKDFEDITLMLDLPKFKEIERMEMLYNFNQNNGTVSTKKKEKGADNKKVPRPYSSRSSMLQTQKGSESVPKSANGIARSESELENKAKKLTEEYLRKRRPKRKKRTSVIS